MIKRNIACWLPVIAMLIVAAFVGCGGGEDEAESGADDVDPTPREEEIMTGNIKVTSSAFDNGAEIPKQYTYQAEDVSPKLTLADVPSGAASLAVICDDPDAPSRKNPRKEGPWVHWVIYNLPGDLREIPQGVPRDPEPEELTGARQGANSWPSDNVGYRGPQPPAGSGPHRYFFKVYALDTVLDLPAGKTDKAALLKAMEGHILDQGVLMGTFEVK